MQAGKEGGVEFGVLGPLQLRIGDADVTPAAAKPRALLLRLIVAGGQQVTAERLIDDLWEGDPPRTAAQTLQSYISQLRKLLGSDRLVSDAAGYRLVVAPDELDAAVFEAGLTRGRLAFGSGDTAGAIDQLDRALSLWRGLPLADARGAAWSIAEATRLSELRLAALETLLEARLAYGQLADVVAAAEATLAEQPLRERVWAVLITSLYKQGRQAEALRAYQRVRTLLGEELGIEPGAELRALEQAVLVQDPALAISDSASHAMPNLPSGVVTFFLTDVVGSTRLWESAPAAMEQALARHDAVLRLAVATYGGVFLKARGEGDSTFSVFRRATDAVSAARAVQLGLAAEAWPVGAEIQVRMALHTGEAVEREGDYYGPTVNRAARLRSLAEAGQVLVSRSTTELVVDHLPDDCRLVELGPRELQDLARPEIVYVLATPSMTTELAADERVERHKSALPVALSRTPFAGFHGRVGERERLDQHLKAVGAGERRVVLIAGEPGIGKTSLAAEVARRAYATGFTVLYGRCDEDVAMPYRPWVEAMGQAVNVLDDKPFAELGRRRLSHLARVVPEIHDRVPNLDATGSTDPEAEPYLLFSAVVAFLRALGATAPIAVVLDDLHWADKPTLALLRHVVAVGDPVPILIVGTYRHSELSGDHPLTGTLTALRREPGVDRINLHGLADDELLAVIEAAAGQHLSGAELDLVHAVHRETDGNPFFAWELVLHLNESGAVSLSESGRWLVSGRIEEASLPESVLEVIGRRVARLGDEVKPVLVVAAVIGREFDLDLLALALDVDAESVLETLESAEASGLVMSVGRGRFMFSHALVYHTLYQDLSPTRRSRIHRRIAESIEVLDPAATRVTELARHWAEAMQPSDAGRAIEFARRAGDQALGSLAPDEAARWFTQALQLLAEHQPENDSSRCELLLGLGRAQCQAGDPQYRKTLLDAARLAQALGDRDRLVRAALTDTKLGSGTVDPDRIAVLEAAVEAVGPSDSIRRARLMAALATQLYFTGDYQRRRRLLDEALAIARRVGDPTTLVDVVWQFNIGLTIPETLEERRSLTAEAVALSETLDDPVIQFFILVARTGIAFETAELEDIDEIVARMEGLSAEIGQPNIEFLIGNPRVSVAVHRGEFEEAERLAVESYTLGVETGQPDALTLYGAQLLWIRWHQGRLAELLELYAEAVQSTPDIPGYKAGIDLALVEAGRADEVAIDVQAIRQLPYDAAWAAALTCWADVAADVGDLEAAQVIFDLLSPFPSVVAYAYALGTGAIAHHLGRLTTVLGRFDEADAFFRQALEIHNRLGDPFHIARTELGWGRMLLERAEQGDADRGRVLVERARDTAERFGCAAVAWTAAALLSG